MSEAKRDTEGEQLLIEQKKELRRKLAGIRQGIPDRVAKEARLLGKLLAYVPSGKKVFVYVSFGSELDTHGFIRNYSGSIFVPFTSGQAMSVVKLENFENLNTDSRGNLAIFSDKKLAADKTQTGIMDINAANKPQNAQITPDIVIVPMLGFDKNCYRLGYGGGFYDRFLADFSGQKIGIAFDEQLCDCLPVESFDVPLDIILTPNAVC